MLRHVFACGAMLALLCCGASAQTPIGPAISPTLSRQINTFAMVGTSREAQQFYFGASSWNYYNQANAQAGQRYNLIYNGGCPGYSSRQFFVGCTTVTGAVGQQFGQGLAGALASHARFVILGNIVNDVAPTPLWTALQIWDNTQAGAEPGVGFLQAIQQIVANHQTPILTGEYGGPNQNAAQIAVYIAFNQIEREYCAQTGSCIYLDFPSALWTSASTPTALSFVPGSMQTGSLIHPDQLGGYLLGQVFNAAIEALVPQTNDLPVSPADSGLANSNFTTQTGGTLSGAGTLTSGAIPSGWTLTIPSGVSVVSSFVPDPNGYGYDWQLAITNAAGANPNITVLGWSTGGAAAIGSQWWGGAYLTTAAGATAFVDSSCNAHVGNGSGGYQYSQGGYVASYAVADFGVTTAHSYACRTPIPLPGSAQPTGGATVTVSGQTPAFWVQPIFTGNGSATVTIARPWLRQVQGTNGGTVE